LRVIRHSSRAEDALAIVEIARREGAETILVGVAYGSEGDVGPQARRALRFVEAIRAAGFDRVETWDESESTQRALAEHAPDEMTDARAAAFLLQSYLDATRPE
jgi:putative Holliday junction resolvase